MGLNRLLGGLRLDSDIREGYVAGVCLQTDKARVGIDTRRIPPDRIDRAAPEPSRFLAVEPDDVVLIVDLDLVAMPLPRREVGVVLIILLPRRSAQRLDFVNGSGPGEEGTIGFTKTRVAARFFVDLDFKPGVHRDKSGVVRRVDRIGRRIGQARIAEANEDAGVVIVDAAGMREQEVETQDEILEALRLVEQQANAPAVLLGDHCPVKPGEEAAAGHLPVRELRVAPVEQVGETRFRRRERRLRH